MTETDHKLPMEPVAEELPLFQDEVSRIAVWRPEPREWLARLLVLAVAAAIFLPNLGGFGLWDPWETHYGEVSRNMIETYDWVSPWWGFKEQIGTEPVNGDWFFSKPIYTFWAEATCMKVFGASDFSIRLPIALLAMAAVFAVYLTFSRIRGRRFGFLAATVLATAPQFFLIARQAQTDMPFVATMVIAMCGFVLAVFGPREEQSDRQFLWRTAGFAGLLLLSTVPQFLIIATDLSLDVAGDLPALRRFLMTVQRNGLYHVLIYGFVTLGLLLAVLVPVFRQWRREGGFDEVFKDRWSRRYYMFAFYILLAHSTLAKGLLGFLLPGFVIGAYLFLTRPMLALRLLLFFSFPPVTWPVLRRNPKFQEARRFEPILGFLMLLVVALPWYVAMFARFGMAYYTRFFIHDHFNRLEAGVHQIDTGTFEHFLKWLGYGMYPWVVFVPLVVVALARTRLRDRSAHNQLRVFLFLWSFLAYALFTLSATKFHHYIFPALPPLAILIAWFLWDSLRTRATWIRVGAVIAIGLHLAFSWELHQEPQNLRNLMTYKYDRPLPEHLPSEPQGQVSPTSTVTWEDSTYYAQVWPAVRWLLEQPWLAYGVAIVFVTVLGLVGLLLFLFVRTRGPGVIVLGVAGAVLAVWSLNYYLAMLAPHWSQKYIFEAYYEDCTRLPNDPEVDAAYTPLIAHLGMEGLFESLGGHKKRVCKEDVISWLLTWRGETYYSYNEIQPINKEATQFEAYLRERNRGEPLYIFMERGKTSSLQSKLDSYTRTLASQDVAGFKDIDSWVVETIHDENQYFILGKATPNRKAAGGIDRSGAEP